MSKLPEEIPPEWNLDEWEQALNISVGTAYACRECGNVVMVTRGGVGVMELICCGANMPKIEAGARSEGRQP
jgi:hypothetical protein